MDSLSFHLLMALSTCAACVTRPLCAQEESVFGKGRGTCEGLVSGQGLAGSPEARGHLLWSYPGEEGVSASSWAIL